MLARWKWSLAFLVLAGVGFFLFSRLRQTKPSTIANAVRVANVTDWNLDDADYFWLSAHETLFFRGSDRKGWTLYRRDVPAGSEEKLEELGRLFHETSGLVGTVIASPDGSRLLWRGRGGVVVGATLDGESHFVVASNGAGELHWLLDSRGWAEAIIVPMGVRLTQVIVHNGARQAGRIIHLKPPRNWMTAPGIVTSGGHYLVVVGSKLKPGAYDAQMLDVDLVAEKPKQQTFTIISRADSGPISPYWPRLSPTGDRFAQFVGVRQTISDPPAWWVRLFPGATRWQFTLRLRVSALKGDALHELGTLEYESKLEGFRRGDTPHSLKWLPDGRRLSFIHDGSLWTAPAY